MFDGLQRVRIRRNLLSGNTQAYALVAGVRTARIDSTVDVTENWWGTTSEFEIINKIFDFDDWNDHAVANFKPFLMEDAFEGGLSVSVFHQLRKFLGTIDAVKGGRERERERKKGEFFFKCIKVIFSLH